MTGATGSPGATEPENAGRYKLLQQIGAGGMGRVYRARDLRLNRDVAIKFLPEWLAQDPSALQRFCREAQATASLNHPNVLAIYDQATIDGAPCLVSELLEGQTLRRVVTAGALPVIDAIEYAQQILDGLAAAHEKGIIHRDLKPENIFVTCDGRVKILDFGLAKQVAGPTDATLETRTAMVSTKRGVILGTLGYQSPEQVRGEKVDARSDLFAFGAVLYELFTGRAAFRRHSEADTIAAVLDTTPASPRSVNGNVPASCDVIVAKLLEKDRDLRYQSAADIRADLRRVRRELSTSPSSIVTGDVPVARVPSRYRRTIIIAVAASLAIAALIGSALFLPAWHAGRQPFEGIAARQLTNAIGWEGDPSVSPDGTLVAYSAEDESGNRHIFVSDSRSGGVPLQLTRGEADDRFPCWTPDGTSVFFSSDRGGGGIFAVSRLGTDVPRLLVEDAAEPAVSPDSTTVAFSRRVPGSNSTRIFVAALNDPARARRVTTENDGLWEHHRPSWSADGRSIVYRAHMAIWQVNLDHKGATRLTAQSQSCDRPVSAPDGSIYYGSNLAGSFALWRRPADGGQPERVTFGTGERDPSLSADGRVLAYAIATADDNLVLHDLHSGAEHRYGGVRTEYLPAFSPDGREVFFVGDLDPAGSQIWAVQVADGRFRPDSLRRITTPPGQASRATCSRDGRYLLYYKILGDKRNIWVVAASGGPAAQITDGRASDTTASWSPDGQRIAFTSERDGHWRIWTMAMANGKSAGTAARLTSGPTEDESPVWSPDGRSVAFIGMAADGATEVWFIPSDGRGQARRVTSGAGARRVQWEPRTGKLLVAGWWSTTRLRVRRVDPISGASEALVPPLVLGSNPYLFDFDISPDGRSVVFSRDDSRSDIWLLDARSDGR